MADMTYEILKYFETYYPKSPLKIRILNVLHENDIKSFEDLIKYKKVDIIKFPNCGKGCTDALEIILKNNGYSFQPEIKKPLELLNEKIEAQEAEIIRLRDEIEELKIENQNLELAVDMNMNLNIKKVELAIKNCEGKTAQAALAEKGE